MSRLATAAADVAHEVATRSEDHRAQCINAAVSRFDDGLQGVRSQIVWGHAHASLWALLEEVRVAAEALLVLEAA